MYPILKLNKGEERRLQAGHMWVFSNEVDTRETPLTAHEPGDPVTIVAHGGKPLGSGYVNPRSLIAARLVVRGKPAPIDQSLLTHRLNIALGLRRRLYRDPCYRLVYGESDGLPGLVVDRYRDVVVAQLTTAGMERLKEPLVAALTKVLKPAGILWRNDVPVRDLEGLPRYVEVAAGSVPEELTIAEGGLEFRVDPRAGQKTGWFFDQAANRERLARYVAGGRVLDAYAYLGAWGLRAAAAGAEEVVCVDVSAAAVAGIEDHAAANRIADRVRAHRADAVAFLKAALAENQRFDAVILDPPALIKRKKDLKAGEAAYRRVNELALRALGTDGILITCSCSYHLAPERLIALLQAAARHVDRQLQILEVLHQGPDHPIHPAIPETSYLKGVIARVLPGS